MNRRRIGTRLGLVGALVVAGCTSGASETVTTAAAPATTAAAPATTAAPEPEVTEAEAEAVTTDPPAVETTVAEASTVETVAPVDGDAPGVTDDSIKIGVTYVDVEALKAVGLDYNLGDYEGTYNALAAVVNEAGGINGRKLELVFGKVDPTAPESAEAECLRLTEDEDVFIMTGYYRDDAALCVLDTHATAVVGGNMNPARVAAAKAPWVSPDADSDVPAAIVKAFADDGLLAGKVGLFGHVSSQSEIDQVVATLKGLGVTPVETGIADAPTDDTAASEAAVKLIAEKFKSSGVDTVLAVGGPGAQWPTNMDDDSSYRPKLLFTAYNAPLAFAASAASGDLSILDGSLAGGLYGPEQARYEEALMTECIAIIEAAGIPTPSPDTTSGEQGDQPYYAALQACPNMVLILSLLERAGEKLNYGTLAAAIDGLEITIPGDPAPRTYGPAPAGDGDPAAFLFKWDTASQALVVADS